MAVATGVGLSRADAVGAGTVGEALHAGEHGEVAAGLGTDAFDDGAGEGEPGATGPQLATTIAAAMASLPTERRTCESRSVT